MYDSIRPYTDAEVQPVLRRLIRDKQLLALLAQYRLPGLYKYVPWLCRWLTMRLMASRIRSIHSIEDLQSQVTSRYISYLLAKTVSNVEYKGLEQLTKVPAYLLISNHRDIVLDSALASYKIKLEGMETLRIATGDNLATLPFVKDLMKLNKSFWVKRGESSPRKKLLALKELSAYIQHSICVDKAPVWIAQREGRAKDSFDTTDVSVLKMLHLCARTTPLREYMKSLHMHTVSVSYEYDPCDLFKAKERHALATKKEYIKSTGEDMRSVVTGLKGHKGRISIAFDQPVCRSPFENVQELAELIDKSITLNYRLFPSNCTALRLLQERDEYKQAYQWLQTRYPEEDFNDAHLQERVAGVEQELRPYLLENYANPCVALWRLHKSEGQHKEP